MSEINYRCVICNKLLLKLAKGSSYGPTFRAVCAEHVEGDKVKGSNVLEDLLRGLQGNKS